MKKISDMKKSEDADMRPEYDFRGGVRGKHHKDYAKGHTVRIRKADGTVERRTSAKSK